MKNKPKISIIIPIYNAEKYLSQCLDSVVNQSFSDIEIICVNDGSTDNTKIILDSYRKKHKNIVVINQKNSGVIQARISGFEAANGEYIGWVDSDDICDQNMYKKMYDKANKENLDIVICNYNFFPTENSKKEKWYKPYNGIVNYNFIQHNTVFWNKIIKKELLNKIDIANLLDRIGESCYAFALINAKKIGTIDDCLYNYRVGHTSLSSNVKKIDWFKKVVVHQENKIKYVKNNKYDKQWIEYFNYQYLYYVSLLAIISAYNNEKELYYNCKKIIRNNNFFDKKYKKYLINDISFTKRLYFKYIVQYNYYLTKIIARIML